MQQAPSFTVYNASAGSGKTFTLVKSYLSIVLGSNDPNYFRYILAVTFTNKAAAEMKERIISTLDDLSSSDTSHQMMPLLIAELNLTPETISERSQRTLQAILQNYSAFSISTLDSFTYRLIRSFAFDLGLSLNFDVEMDAVSLLNAAVEELISQIGIDQKLTKLLIDFSIQKIEDDTAWDISRELKEIAILLLRENDAKHVKKLQKRPIDDFLNFKNQLHKRQKEIKSRFVELGNRGLEIIQTSTVPHSAFSYGAEFPKHFIKLKKAQLSTLIFDGRLDKNIDGDHSFYAGKATAQDKASIDGILEELKLIYLQSKEYYSSVYGAFVLNDLFLKNIIPLAVLAKIKSALDQIKADRNVYLNAEFNGIIRQNLQEQPAAYIYERLGDKFKHYFIDEMQDTSTLQWLNLVPLIHNTLSEENSSLLIVGDAKQSIYRWRGSEPEQFLKLTQPGDSSSHNPFHIDKKLAALETNYRSFSEIIQFNNNFFQYLSTVFNKDDYQRLYFKENKQGITDKNGGYVQLSFIENGHSGDELNEAYAEQVHQRIEQCLAQFEPREICVLVRKKAQGFVLADYLSAKGIEIVSSETLLLKNSEKIVFLINLLSYIDNPNDDNFLFNALYFLIEDRELNEDRSLFLSRFVKEDSTAVFKKLTQFDLHFELDKFKQLSLFDGVEYMIRAFGLDQEPDAYVLYFLEEIFQYSQKKSNVLSVFLAEWESKKEKLSIVVPDNLNAVQIMTIHKSKGLEFPVVIYPFDLDLYKGKMEQEWFPVDKQFSDYPFENLLIPMKKALEKSGEIGEQLFRAYLDEKEFDTINLWYVAFTRAIEQLYIIGEIKPTDKELKTSSQFLIHYLKENGRWGESQHQFEFGSIERKSILEARSGENRYLSRINSSEWERHQITIAPQMTWLASLNEGAIAYGTLLHEMMSKVILADDIDRISQLYVLQGKLQHTEYDEVLRRLKGIVHHEKLQPYFEPGLTVFNEREILNPTGQIFIPDRLVIFADQTAVIIDYKTGKISPGHQQQLAQYKIQVEAIGYSVSKCILVYIDAEIEVQEVY